MDYSALWPFNSFLGIFVSNFRYWFLAGMHAAQRRLARPKPTRLQQRASSYSHMRKSSCLAFQFFFFFNSAGEWFTLVGLNKQTIITSFSEQKLNAGIEYISFRKLHTLFANTICLDTPTWFLQYFFQYRTRCKTNSFVYYKHNCEIFFILLCKNVNIRALSHGFNLILNNKGKFRGYRFAS
jgi:hypothetical protein